MTTPPHPVLPLPLELGPLGELLRRARKAARYSLEELARVLDYSASYLSDIETGKRGVTRQLCDQLSRALGLDRIELYARAGHLPDEVLRYLERTPQALTVLEILAKGNATPEQIRAICGQLEPGGDRSP